MAKEGRVEAKYLAHAADLAAHTYSTFQKIRTGQYIQPFCTYATTTAMVASILYATPLIIPRSITVDRIAIEVTTASAGKVARLGIYADGTNLYPGALVVDAGEVSVGSNAVVAATLTSVALAKGLYWVVLVGNGTPTLRCINNAVITHHILGIISTAFITFNSVWSVAHTYTAGVTTLPSTFTAGGTLVVAPAPVIPVRVETLA